MLGSVMVVGSGCQWLARRLGLPAIPLLLIAGFIMGPVSGWLNPDVLFGDGLFAIVSLSVAVILFEGGLHLRFDDLRPVAGPVLRLTTVGLVITGTSSAFLGWFLLDYSVEVAVLFGTILVVTGPTVVVPMLRNINVPERVRIISIWEGIVNDPVGSVLAVVVFELAIAERFVLALPRGLVTLGWVILIGGGSALAGGWILKKAFAGGWVGDELKNPVTLTFVLGLFVFCETIQPESGLVGVTVLGVQLANQRSVDIKRILEFEKEIGTLLLPVLFILLSARFDISSFRAIGVESFVFLGMLILVVRPAAVLASSLLDDVTVRESIALVFLAPRGLVAAFMASFFSLKLAELGYERAGVLDTEVFFVIAGTGLFYSLVGPLVLNTLDWNQGGSEKLRPGNQVHSTGDAKNDQ